MLAQYATFCWSRKWAAAPGPGSRALVIAHWSSHAAIITFITLCNRWFFTMRMKMEAKMRISRGDYSHVTIFVFCNDEEADF